MTTTTNPTQTRMRRSFRRPELVAWMRLARVVHKIDRNSADQLRCRGLSLAQFDVLAHVGADEGITQQELADSLLVTKGNVCQLLDRMETSGLIERRQVGRTNLLYLTDAGRDLFEEIVPAHEDAVARCFSGLSAQELQELVTTLRKLERSLDTDDTMA